MMKALVLLGVMVAALWGAIWVAFHGVSARGEPSAFETFVARNLRHLAIPAGARDTKNPVAASPEVVAEGRAHFADHCAVCHANDGGGDTDIGHGLYPKPPDMRKEGTQSLSDGEIFYIIRNGVRFTGMPAWGGEGDAEDDKDSWELVHFIRHLPEIQPQELEEMKRLSPQSPQEVEEDNEEQEQEGAAAETPPPPQHP